MAAAPTVVYCTIALDVDMERAPSWMRTVLCMLGAHVEGGVLTALPLQSFEIEAQHTLAFRTL